MLSKRTRREKVGLSVVSVLKRKQFLSLSSWAYFWKCRKDTVSEEKNSDGLGRKQGEAKFRKQSTGRIDAGARRDRTPGCGKAGIRMVVSNLLSVISCCVASGNVPDLGISSSARCQQLRFPSQRT